MSLASPALCTRALPPSPRRDRERDSVGDPHSPHSRTQTHTHSQPLSPPHTETHTLAQTYSPPQTHSHSQKQHTFPQRRSNQTSSSTGSDSTGNSSANGSGVSVSVSVKMRVRSEEERERDREREREIAVTMSSGKNVRGVSHRTMRKIRAIREGNSNDNSSVASGNSYTNSVINNNNNSNNNSDAQSVSSSGSGALLTRGTHTHSHTHAHTHTHTHTHVHGRSSRSASNHSSLSSTSSVESDLPPLPYGSARSGAYTSPRAFPSPAPRPWTVSSGRTTAGNGKPPSPRNYVPSSPLVEVSSAPRHSFPPTNASPLKEKERRRDKERDRERLRDDVSVCSSHSHTSHASQVSQTSRLSRTSRDSLSQSSHSRRSRRTAQAQAFDYGNLQSMVAQRSVTQTVSDTQQATDTQSPSYSPSRTQTRSSQRDESDAESTHTTHSHAHSLTHSHEANAAQRLREKLHLGSQPIGTNTESLDSAEETRLFYLHQQQSRSNDQPDSTDLNGKDPNRGLFSGDFAYYGANLETPSSGGLSLPGGSLPCFSSISTSSVEPAVSVSVSVSMSRDEAVPEVVPPLLRVVFAGDSGAGKTSLLDRFLRDHPALTHTSLSCTRTLTPRDTAAPHSLNDARTAEPQGQTPQPPHTPALRPLPSPARSDIAGIDPLSPLAGEPLLSLTLSHTRSIHTLCVSSSSERERETESELERGRAALAFTSESEKTRTHNHTSSQPHTPSQKAQAHNSLAETESERIREREPHSVCVPLSVRGAPCHLQLFDTSALSHTDTFTRTPSQQMAQTRAVYQNAHVFALIFDITNDTATQRIAQWIDDLRLTLQDIQESSSSSQSQSQSHNNRDSNAFTNTSSTRNNADMSTLTSSLSNPSSHTQSNSVSFPPIVLVGNKVDREEERVSSSEYLERYARENDLQGYVETSARSGYNVDELMDALARLALTRVTRNSAWVGNSLSESCVSTLTQSHSGFSQSQSNGTGIASVDCDVPTPSRTHTHAHARAEQALRPEAHLYADSTDSVLILDSRTNKIVSVPRSTLPSASQPHTPTQTQPQSHTQIEKRSPRDEALAALRKQSTARGSQWTSHRALTTVREDGSSSASSPASLSLSPSAKAEQLAQTQSQTHTPRALSRVSTLRERQREKKRESQRRKERERGNRERESECESEAYDEEEDEDEEGYDEFGEAEEDIVFKPAPRSQRDRERDREREPQRRRTRERIIINRQHGRQCCVIS